MSQETEYLPWRTGINRLSYVIDMLESTISFGKFQTYLVKLVEPIYTKLGWVEKDDDSWLEKQLRSIILSFACTRGVPDCVSKSKQYYSEWMNLNGSSNSIPTNYRSFVYCTGIREGGEKEWSFASDQYLKETDANIKNTLQAAMSCSRIPWIISKFLNNQIDTNIVRQQDALSGLRSAATKAESNLKTWYFIKDNWELLFERFNLFDFK